MQCFQEEMFRCLGIACRTQEKFERVPLGIDGSIKIHPHFFDLDRRLVHFPRVVARFQMWSTTLVEFWSIPLHPAEDGAVIDMETAFEHHLLQIAVAEPHTVGTSARTTE